MSEIFIVGDCNQPKDEKHLHIISIRCNTPSYLAWNVGCSSYNGVYWSVEEDYRTI
jgi:hypothetical protein